jgi:hypothetical protein
MDQNNAWDKHFGDSRHFLCFSILRFRPTRYCRKIEKKTVLKTRLKTKENTYALDYETIRVRWLRSFLIEAFMVFWTSQKTRFVLNEKNYTSNKLSVRKQTKIYYFVVQCSFLKLKYVLLRFKIIAFLG